MSAPRTRPAPIGEPPAIQYVAVGKLRVDPRYQRSIETGTSRKLIERIADRWDWRLCPPLLGSQRADGMYVIDGQHRAAAAQARGDIAHLPVSVLYELTLADEARIFAAVNHERKTVTRLDSYRAALAAEDEGAVTIARLAAAAGLTIAATSRDSADTVGAIGFVTQLRRALDNRGEKLVGAALATLGEALAGEKLGEVGGALFGALILLLGVDERPRAEVTGAVRRRTAAEWAELVRAQGVTGGQSRIIVLRKAIEADLRPVRPAFPAPPRSGGGGNPPSRIDLNRIPSSMEQRAAGWSAGR